MPRPQDSRTPVWRRLRRALAHHCGWVWRQGGRVRGLLGRGAAERARSEDDRRHVEARARFWAELREGQREAAAHGARLDP